MSDKTTPKANPPVLGLPRKARYRPVSLLPLRTRQHRHYERAALLTDAYLPHPGRMTPARLSRVLRVARALAAELDPPPLVSRFFRS